MRTVPGHILIRLPGEETMSQAGGMVMIQAGMLIMRSLPSTVRSMNSMHAVIGSRTEAR